MVASYDDFRPTSRLRSSAQGRSVERAMQIYAEDELAAEASGDVPQRGDSIGEVPDKLYCSDVDVQQVPGAVNSAGLFLFDITATYQPLDKAPVESKARWTVNGQNDQVKRYAVDGAADHQDYPLEGGSGPEAQDVYDGPGINVTEQGPEGVEVDDPYEVLRIDLWKAPADVGAYLEILRDLKFNNPVNDDDFAGPWGTYAAGEARLHGYTVSHVNGELDQISLEFLCRKNVTFEATAQGQTFDVNKAGHQYYWQRGIKKTAAGNETKNQVEVHDVHVDTVYREGDFSTLGITYAMFDMEEPS